MSSLIRRGASARGRSTASSGSTSGRSSRRSARRSSQLDTGGQQVDKLNAGWSNARWILVGVVLAGSLWLFLSTVRHVPMPYSLPFEVWYDETDGEAGALLVVPQFEFWYGNWRSVLMWTAIFMLFLPGFVQPRRRVEWRNAGLSSGPRHRA